MLQPGKHGVFTILYKVCSVMHIYTLSKQDKVVLTAIYQWMTRCYGTKLDKRHPLEIHISLNNDSLYRGFAGAVSKACAR